jgi:hypothetical protein
MTDLTVSLPRNEWVEVVSALRARAQFSSYFPVSGFEKRRRLFAIVNEIEMQMAPANESRKAPEGIDRL